VVVHKVAEPMPKVLKSESSYSEEEEIERRSSGGRSDAFTSSQTREHSEASSEPIPSDARPGPPELRPQADSDSRVPVSLRSARTYVCSREKKGKILGSTITFTFHENFVLLFQARFKKTKTQIYGAGKNMNRDSVPDCILLTSSKLLDFGLRSEVTGCEILAIRFSFARGPVENCRRMSVTIFEDRMTPLRMVTRNPALGSDGKVAHDFEGRFAVNSVKNAVLIMKADGPAVALVRKAGKNVIEIELRIHHEPVWAFAIAIASFLSKAK
jgi:hypothetical protein